MATMSSLSVSRKWTSWIMESTEKVLTTEKSVRLTTCIGLYWSVSMIIREESELKVIF